MLVTDVPEVDPQFRCYRPPSPPYHGAYVRLGDSPRAAREYEVRLALTLRTRPADRLVFGRELQAFFPNLGTLP